MPYTTPKTDWKSTDGVTNADLNRIEGNIKETYDRGLIGSDTMVNASTNFNSMTTAGVYPVGGASIGVNGPVGAYGYGTLEVFTAGSTMVTQIYTPHGQTQGEFYVRSKYNASDWGSWNQFSPDTVYRTFRYDKDENGIFTRIEHVRPNGGTLAMKSVLSGGTSPQYTTRTVTYYGVNGTTVAGTHSRTITYDADGDWIGEA